MPWNGNLAQAMEFAVSQFGARKPPEISEPITPTETMVCRWDFFMLTYLALGLGGGIGTIALGPTLRSPRAAEFDLRGKIHASRVGG